MTRLSADEPRFFGNTDSETLQNLIDFAEQTGEKTVVIPRINARTGEAVWNIEKAVLLPDHLTVILDDCHLRLVDGVRDNIFRNKNLGTPLGRTLAGEQRGIRLIGRGEPLLDGGEPNGMSETLNRENPGKYPHMSCNLLVFFSNVRDFEVRGLNCTRSRWWALCFVYCRWGVLSDLHFEMRATLENQDGIDLRLGCEFITIQNIFGITGDDTIALTALNGFERKLEVEGKSSDIHDITIRNVISSTHGCSLLRFLCRDGNRIYNVTAENLKDTGKSISAAAVLFGTSAKFGKRFCELGEFENVVVRNVFSRGQKAIIFAEPVRNALVENVTACAGSEVGFLFGDPFACEDLLIRNFHFEGDPESANCVFSVSPDAAAKMSDYTIEHVRVRSAPVLFRRAKLEIRDLRCGGETREFDPEKPVLPSAYGRYFRCFNGVEIQNRPKDNRFTSTVKEDF